MGWSMTKILLIGQNNFARRFLSQELMFEVCQLASAMGDASSLEIIEQSSPDLVIIDIDQAPSHGLDLLRDIRDQHYNLPVILLSAHDAHRQDPRAMASDFLVGKPLDLKELTGKIVMALEADPSMSLAAAG